MAPQIMESGKVGVDATRTHSRQVDFGGNVLDRLTARSEVDAFGRRRIQ